MMQEQSPSIVFDILSVCWFEFLLLSKSDSVTQIPSHPGTSAKMTMGCRSKPFWDQHLFKRGDSFELVPPQSPRDVFLLFHKCTFSVFSPMKQKMFHLNPTCQISEHLVIITLYNLPKLAFTSLRINAFIPTASNQQPNQLSSLVNPAHVLT